MFSISVPYRDSAPDMNILVAEYGDSLLRMCFLYLKDIHLAEDAVQETFVKVYKNYAAFDQKCSEKTWMMRIAINVCKNYLRSSWWKRIDTDAVLENFPAAEPDEQDETLIYRIMELPPKYKEVILLHYYQEMKVREISETLGIPEGTVSVRLKRARERLKSKLKGWYYDE